jgi:hypothetical protein
MLHMTIANDMISTSERMIWLFSKRVGNAIAKLQIKKYSTYIVATPFWPSVGVKPNTWKSWRLGVFRDSRMFRARQQGAKHLALGCS